MGQYSWFTQDTHRRIINNMPMRVVMTDDKGNQYVEECYEGYGEFGGKDYYELLAEMNGIPSADRLDGIDLAFSKSPDGISSGVLYPSLSECGQYFGGESPEIDPEQGFPDIDCDDYRCDLDEDEW